MKKLTLALAVLGACAAGSTFAATGTITFNGELVAATCVPVITGGGATGNTANNTVNLATLNVTSVPKAVGATAGVTPFKIALTDGGAGTCTVGGKTATPYFEYETAKVNTSGRLINDGGTANNVDVQLLLNSTTGTVVDASQDFNTQTTANKHAVTNGHEFNYAARYYVTDAAGATAGTVKSSVSYSIVYK